MFEGLILEVGLFEHFRICIEHGLGSAETEILEGLDHPSLYLVAEFIEVDILLTLLKVAVYIDRIAGELSREANVESPFSDCKAYLLGM